MDQRSLSIILLIIEMRCFGINTLATSVTYGDYTGKDESIDSFLLTFNLYAT